LAGVAAVLESVLDAVLVFDIRGEVIVYANQSVENLFGYLPSELVGRSVDMLVPSGQRATHERRRREYAQGPVARPMAEGLPLEGLRKDGSRFTAEISLAPLTAVSDAYVTAVVRDVTAAHARAHSERHLARSQQVAGVGSWERDHVTGQVQWSPEFFRMLDRAPGAVEPSPELLYQHIHPDDRPLLGAEYRRALVDGGPMFAVVRGIVAPQAFALRGWLELDSHGVPVRSVGTLHDITDLDAVKRELTSTSGRFRATFDQAPIGMALIDVRPGRPICRLMANPALAQLTGLTEAELLNEPILSRVHPDDVPAHARRLSEVSSGARDQMHAAEIRIIRSDRTQRWVAVSANLVRDPTGAPEYVVAHVQDISARKHAEQQRRDVAVRDARIASVLQGSLLPFVSNRVGPLWVASRYLPAGSGELVGGDWTDVFALPNGRIGLVVGDVAGHGIEAAASMTRLRAVVRMLATSGLRPAGVLRRLNDATYMTDVDADVDLATIVHAQLDPATGVLLYSSAGHLPLLMLSTDGPDQRLVVDPVPAIGGPPIGVLPRVDYQEHAVDVEPESFIIGFTDGLIERRGHDLDESLLALQTGLAHLPLDNESSVETLADAILDLAPDRGAHDDLAVIVVSLQPHGDAQINLPRSARTRTTDSIDKLRQVDRAVDLDQYLATATSTIASHPPQ
jgi:PAS domain S-box-containing protein